MLTAVLRVLDWCPLLIYIWGDGERNAQYISRHWYLCDMFMHVSWNHLHRKFYLWIREVNRRNSPATTLTTGPLSIYKVKGLWICDQLFKPSFFFFSFFFLQIKKSNRTDLYTHCNIQFTIISLHSTLKLHSNFMLSESHFLRHNRQKCYDFFFFLI